MFPPWRTPQRIEEKFYLDDVERGVISRKQVFNERPIGIQGICFNKRKPSFNDIRIRKAFVYAFDRKKFNEKLFYNSYYMMNSYYSGTEYENHSNPQLGFNLDSAKMLLAEAQGGIKKSDGYLIKTGMFLKSNYRSLKVSIDILRFIRRILKKVEYILTWYAPYQRIALLNKFGYHGGMLSKIAGYESLIYLWFYDPKNFPTLTKPLEIKTEK